MFEVVGVIKRRVVMHYLSVIYNSLLKFSEIRLQFYRYGSKLDVWFEISYSPEGRE